MPSAAINTHVLNLVFLGVCGLDLLWYMVTVLVCTGYCEWESLQGAEAGN